MDNKDIFMSKYNYREIDSCATCIYFDSADNCQKLESMGINEILNSNYICDLFIEGYR